jgi:hypothetical protein
LLTAFVAVGVSAQNKPTREVQPNNAATQAVPQIDNTLPEYKIAQWTKSVEKRDSVLKSSTTLKDNQRVDSLKLSAAERDSIILYQETMLTERADYEYLKNRLAALEIYEFLGRRDMAVFTDNKYQNFDENAINLLSSCNQTHYLLIKKIHLVNDSLAKISEDISDINIQKLVTPLFSIKEVKQKLYEKAEKDLLNADEKMTEIDGMNLSVLSTEQQQFYKQTVIKKYRAVYKKIYP